MRAGAADLDSLGLEFLGGLGDAGKGEAKKTAGQCRVFPTFY